jgi:glycyl-tRNA synthetase beta chain
MPQLLIDLFSEEIPARMQKRAADDLVKLLMDGFTKAGLIPTGQQGFSAPRRIAACFEGLPAATADVREERKGPRTDAPPQALEGFLRGAGLASLSEARVVSDPKKGDFYVADIVKPGRATADLIAELVPQVIRNFPWPKSMRWGEGTLRWVRPLHRIVCLFDGAVVPFEVDGISSGATTEGHRFHGSGPFTVRDFDDWEAQLRANHVILDREERKAAILADARTLCQAQNLELVEDEGLAEEVTGLVDEPHVILGRLDPAFLDLPPEVIRLTLRVNQKYFVVRDPATGQLAPHFVVVSNVKAADGGAKIAAGNARVLAARLNDARYFWDLDRKTPLDARVAKLDTIVFHEKLGSVGDKVRRIVELAGELAPLVGADPALVRRAALLAKADLVTEMVGEFPELQGVMGRYYAQHAGEPAAVADAIRDHYRPVGPSDAVPTEPVAVAVALADKADTLNGFFGIGEKPTGSGDPYALRRAALGVIRIVQDSRLRLPLRSLLTAPDLMDFVLERLRVFLRDQGTAPDVSEAAFAVRDDDLVRLCARVAALSAFLKTDDGANLVAGFKRGANILRAEEKKGPLPEGVAVDPALLVEPAELALHQALFAAAAIVDAKLGAEDFDGAMAALAALRAPVDGFFEAVLVNDPDPARRSNRLALLIALRDLTRQVADFSKLAG